MIVDNFKSDEDWFYRPVPNSNHALWIVAHLGLSDNMFASKFRPEIDHKPDGWQDLFWFGSEIQEDRNAYPSPAEVLNYFRDRREVLMKVLDEVSDEELNAAAPPEGDRSAVAGAPSIGQLFIFASFHEGIHSGQLTVIDRGLGNEPMMRPQPAEATKD
jgi:hypothetical protein